MKVAIAAAALAALLGLPAVEQAAAQTPELMMQRCRIRAHNTFRLRLPDIDTKYEGTRVDGTRVVNGTAYAKAGQKTFQCSFEKTGRRIIRFVVN